MRRLTRDERKRFLDGLGPILVFAGAGAFMLGGSMFWLPAGYFAWRLCEKACPRDWSCEKDRRAVLRLFRINGSRCWDLQGAHYVNDGHYVHLVPHGDEVRVSP